MGTLSGFCQLQCLFGPALLDQALPHPHKNPPFPSTLHTPPQPMNPPVHLFNTYLVYFFYVYWHLVQACMFPKRFPVSVAIHLHLAALPLASLLSLARAWQAPAAPRILYHTPLLVFVGDSPPILNINLHSITRKRNQLKEQKWLGCLKSQHKKKKPSFII